MCTNSAWTILSCVEIKMTVTGQTPRLLFAREMSTRIYSVQCSALFLPNCNVIVISGDNYRINSYCCRLASKKL